MGKAHRYYHYFCDYMDHTRIISLLPAATELIYALGLGHLLVGRSHACDYPAEVLSLPACTTVNIDLEDSLQIDKAVNSRVSQALSIYDINEELIKQLQPDFIITQSQCEVCAVSENLLQQTISSVIGKDCKIISLESASLAEVFETFKTLGNQLQAAETSVDLLERIEERSDIIRHKLKFISDKPLVACVEWLSPMMISGNWIPEMVELAGGVPILAEAGKHSPYIQNETLIEANPEILILMPCGFSIAQTLKEINLILDIPGFKNLRAVKENRIYIVDGSQYFNRPGPRIIDSIEILAEIINPKQFVFGYEGEGWIKFELID